jgi:hypothetical protein
MIPEFLTRERIDESGFLRLSTEEQVTYLSGWIGDHAEVCKYAMFPESLADEDSNIGVFRQDSRDVYVYLRDILKVAKARDDFFVSNLATNMEASIDFLAEEYMKGYLARAYRKVAPDGSDVPILKTDDTRVFMEN